MYEWLRKRLKHGLLISGERPESSNIVEGLDVADSPPIAYSPSLANNAPASITDVRSWTSLSKYDLDYLFHNINKHLLSLYINDKVIFHELGALDRAIRRLYLIAREKELDSTNKTSAARCGEFSNPNIMDPERSDVYTLPNGGAIQLPFTLSNNAIMYTATSRLVSGAGITSDSGDDASSVFRHNLWSRRVITKSPTTINYRITCELKSPARLIVLSCSPMFGSKVEVSIEYKGATTYPEQTTIGSDLVANIFSLAEKIHIDVSNTTSYGKGENIAILGLADFYISKQTFSEKGTWVSKNVVKAPMFARSMTLNVTGSDLDNVTFSVIVKDISDNELFIRPDDELSFNRVQPVTSHIRWRPRLNIGNLWFDTIRLTDIAMNTLVLLPAVLRFTYSSYIYPYQKHHPTMADWYSPPLGMTIFERRFPFNIMTWPNDPSPNGDIVVLDDDMDNLNVKATFYVYPIGLSGLDINQYISCKNVRGQIYLNGEPILSVNAGANIEEFKVKMSLIPGRFNRIDLLGFRWNLGRAQDKSANNATIINIQNLCKSFLKHAVCQEPGFLKLVPYDDVLFRRKNLSLNHAGIRRRNAGNYDLAFYKNVYPLAMAYEIVEDYITDVRLVARLKRSQSEFTPVLKDFSVVFNA